MVLSARNAVLAGLSLLTGGLVFPSAYDAVAGDPMPPAAAAPTPCVDCDADEDGLADEAERAIGTDPESPDSDRDGVDDGSEKDAATDPNAVDTDGDTIPDGREPEIGLDPTNPDTDGDGLHDGEETLYGTNPRRADTDDDGLFDGAEARVALCDPLDPDTDGDLHSDASEVAGGSLCRDPASVPAAPGVATPGTQATAGMETPADGLAPVR